MFTAAESVEGKISLQHKTTSFSNNLLQLVVNSDTSDVKRNKECTHRHTFEHVWLAGSPAWFGAGIQLHHSSENGSSDYRKGKHRPLGSVWVCVHLLSLYMLSLYNQSECPTRFSLWMRFRLGSDFIIQFDTQFRGCLYSWDLGEMFVSERHEIFFVTLAVYT